MVKEVADADDLKKLQETDASHDAAIAANLTKDSQQDQRLDANDQRDSATAQTLEELKQENAELKSENDELKAENVAQDARLKAIEDRLDAGETPQDPGSDPGTEDPGAGDPVDEDPPTETVNRVHMPAGVQETVTVSGTGNLIIDISGHGSPDHYVSADGTGPLLFDDGLHVIDHHSTGSAVIMTGFDTFQFANGDQLYPTIYQVASFTAEGGTPPAPPPAGGDGLAVAIPGPFDRPRRTGDLPAIKFQPADLVAQKLILPLKSEIAINPQTFPNYPRGSSYKEAGLTPYMPQTGGRPDIGLYTEAAATWICGGDPNNMFVQAEAHADVPVHFDGLDVDATPWAQTYDPRAEKGSPYYKVGGYAVTPESAHYPSLSYLPYLATRDNYYLGELQAAAHFAVISGPGTPDYRPLLEGGQARAVAWTSRTLAEIYLATLEAEKDGTLPANVHGSAYWKRRLDLYRDGIIKQYVKSSDVQVQAFRTIVNDGFFAFISPWMQDYFGAVLGWMIYTGKFEDWRPIYEWSIEQALRRAAFGQRAIGYHWFPGNTKDDKGNVTIGATDYASLIARNPDVIGDTEYHAAYRANLKIATMNGIAGAEAAFNMANSLTVNYRPKKWAV